MERNQSANKTTENQKLTPRHTTRQPSNPIQPIPRACFDLCLAAGLAQAASFFLAGGGRGGFGLGEFCHVSL
jgi:hypothetical protein